MRKSLQLSSKISETRQFLNEFAGIDAPSEEQLAEAEARSAALSKLEREYRVALVTESEEEERKSREEPDAERRELNALLDRAEVSQYVGAALTNASVGGAEAELSAGFNLPVGQFPLDLLEARQAPTDAPTEQRADAATPAPATTGVQQQTIGARVFGRSVAGMVGYQFPTMGPGQTMYPYITSGPSAQAYAADAEISSVAGAFAVSTLGPKRIGSRLTFRELDTLKLSGMESALRADIVAALQDEVDEQLLIGDGVDPNIKGVYNGLVAANTSTAVATFQSAVKDLGSMIDGKYAHGLNDLVLVSHPDLRQFFIPLFRSNDSELTAEDYIVNRCGGYFTSSHMPGTTATKVGALIYRRGSGLPVTAVAPTWRGVEVQRDPYTAGAKGWTFLTVHIYMNSAVVRSDAYQRLDFKVS